ncbi:hypothetical protein KN952_000457, partial [Campylobacter lari]|nr:hypothetical protein [Campylobacter lari]
IIMKNLTLREKQDLEAYVFSNIERKKMALGRILKLYYLRFFRLVF